MAIVYQPCGIVLPVTAEIVVVQGALKRLKSRRAGTPVGTPRPCSEPERREIELAVRHARNQRAIRLLDQWSEEGDENEQRETFEALKNGLNRSHSSNRLMFP